MLAKGPVGPYTPYEELPEFLTPEEHRRVTRLTRNASYEAIRRGDIPHKRYGRLIRIAKTVLLEVNK